MSSVTWATRRPSPAAEQFGPIVPVIAYDDVEQAVDGPTTASTASPRPCGPPTIERGLGVARQIEAGSTFINTHAFESLDLRMPFGGIKESGIGREFGEAGMREYVEEHAIRP